MYRHLQSIAAFVAVAETGAFVKAARKLGVAPSVISHHIAKLEEHLDETLLYRTTRKLTLSDKGRTLFEAAQGGLNGIELALERIKDQHETVVGALRIALPAFVPDPLLEERIMKFAANYPEVALTLDYADQVVDLLEGGYDLSIRLGKPPSSSFLRRKLGEVRHLLVASPEFLLKHGPLGKPSDLSAVPAVMMQGTPDEILLRFGGRECRVALEVSQIQVQSIFAAKAASLAGLGVGNLPEPLLSAELASGALARVLPDWELPKLTIQAIWPETTRRMNLTKRLLDFLVDPQRPVSQRPQES